jgi:hypothetical protein
MTTIITDKATHTVQTPPFRVAESLPSEWLKTSFSGLRHCIRNDGNTLLTGRIRKFKKLINKYNK